MDSPNGPVVIYQEQTHTMPTSVAGMLFQPISDYVSLTSPLGFRLKWNRRGTVLLKMGNQMRNKTCGLCGRFDGSVLNDFEMADGVITDNVEAFVNSWTMNKLGDQCPKGAVVEHPCNSVGRPRAEAATAACDKIFDARFSACHYLVDARPYFEACRMDYCACSETSDNCICNSLEEYFRECVRLGGQLEGGWRSSELCPRTCPAGMVYEDCGTSCPTTCKNTVYACEDEHCVDGCHCPEGTVLYKDQCLHKSLCPCSHSGKDYEHGARITEDCNACECLGGKWECTNEKCPARCSFVGDPHYTTFDGLKYEFLGSCSYYLVYHDNFTIIQESGPCPARSPESSMEEEHSVETEFCTHSLSVTYQGSNLVLKPNTQPILDDIGINTYPFSENGFIVDAASSMFTKVDLSNDVSLLWDGKKRIYIDAPRSIQGQTKGLCGTFNDNQNDDLITPDDDIEADITIFASRWKTPSNSCHKRSRRSAEMSPCSLQQHKLDDAIELCSLLKSNVFEECQNEVDPDPFYRRCMSDLCACNKELEECLCSSFSDYAANCARKSVVVNWVQDITPCMPPCEYGQVYQECGNPCKTSCLTIAASEDCQERCVQGCACPDGMTLNAEGFCIPIDQCPCVYKRKEYTPNSAKLQGTNMCECRNAVWDCRPARLEELVHLGNDMMTLKEPFECDSSKNEKFTECMPTCRQTCQNLKIPQNCLTLDCQPGCQCADGYVLDEDLNQCVRRSECGCRHGQRKYAEGSKIQKDCNLCTCEQGTWKCNAQVCPGICTAWGESHFKTFDGRIFDFHGDCEYILARGTLLVAPFTLSVQNVPCGTSGVTCSKSFTLDLGGDAKITLSRDEPLPTITLGSRLMVYEVGLFVSVYTDVGISLKWDKGTRMYITADPRWRGKMVGLCGNFNGDQSDDFLTPFGGIPEALPTLFADSWKIQETCPASQNIEDACALHPDRESWSHQKCAILKSDLFAPCHSEVTLAPFYERCVFDTCACDIGGDCECLCTAIAAYAQECNVRGVHIKWRTQELCPIQCEECATYESCMTPCPVMTCETQEVYDNIDCNDESCIEGCTPKPCPAGQIFNNARELKCIPEVDCVVPCLEVNGKLYNEGERITDPEVVDVCQTCHCLRGEVTCTGEPCPTTTPALPLPQRACRTTGWTPWMNTPRVTGGDYENPQTVGLFNAYSKFCGLHSVTDIECRVVESKVSYAETGQNVLCDLPEGLICKDELQDSEMCHDYEIRLYCQCGPVQTTTIQPSSTQPPVRPMCVVPGWSYWMNSHTPNENGELETIQNLRATRLFCPDDEIEDVQCRNVLTGDLYDGQDSHVSCDKDIGLECSSTDGYQCDDYEIRFYCRCEFTECDYPRGMKNGNIKSSQIVVSSFWMEDTDGDKGRVNGPSAWRSGNTELPQWIQVDLEEVQEFTGVYTQGNPLKDEWVTAFKLSYSSDGLEFTDVKEPDGSSKIFPGNNDQNTPVYNGFPTFYARYVRLHPVDWHNWISLRMELLGCNRKIAPPTTTTTVPSCIPGWTDYFNVDSPKNPGDDGDEETIERILEEHQEICRGGTIKNIECSSTQEGKIVDYRKTGQFGLKCSKNVGFICDNNLQDRGETCLDYMVRFFCFCEITTPKPVPTTTPTTATTVLTTTISRCPPGQIYDVCAYRCNQTCLSFLSILHERLECKDNECVEGCRPANGCNYPHFWRDFATCVLRDECSCVLNGSLLGPGEVVQQGCEKCQCTDNTLACAQIPDCGKTTVTAAPHHIETGIPIVNPDCWTDWINIDSPATGGGDLENPPAIRRQFEFCAYPAEIECRRADTKQKSSDVGQNLVCDVDNGLLCWNSDNVETDCYDYEIRFFCPCETTPISTTTTTTVAPSAAPPAPCVHGWTEWFNKHTPNSAGEYETVQSIRVSGGSICSSDMITAIACRKATGPEPQSLQHGAICDLGSGLMCRNSDMILGETCSDYEVKFFCDCPTQPPTTVTTTPTPTTPTTEVPTTPRLCDTWSDWFNENHPFESAANKGSKKEGAKGKGNTSDMEKRMLFRLQQEDNFCLTGDVTAIECRDAETDLDYTQTGDSKLICNVKTGFRCRGKDQQSRVCRDYKIRYFCSCRMARILPSTTTTTRPPICVDEMGLGNGALSDSQITASTSRGTFSDVRYIRLNTTQTQSHSGGWVSDILDEDQYVQIDFLEPRTLTGVVTQGRELVSQWVTSYQVMYSEDAVNWNYLSDKDGHHTIFPGNDDSETTVTNFFPNPVRARYIRINPVTWNNWISMRLEVLGCFEPYPITTTTKAPCTESEKLERVACEIRGPSFNTFDGYEYDYEICDHTLTKGVGNAVFSVEVHKECYGKYGNCSRYVELNIDGDKVRMGPRLDDILINGNGVGSQNLWVLQKKFPNIRFSEADDNVMISSLQYDFAVSFNSRQDIVILISACPSYEVVGMCGNANVNALDDKQRPDGSLVPSDFDFGDSWSIGDIERCIRPVCDAEIMYEAIDVCDKLKFPPLSTCASYIRIPDSVHKCIDFFCECSPHATVSPHESCSCQAYENFVKECEEIGNIRLDGWEYARGCVEEVREHTTVIPSVIIFTKCFEPMGFESEELPISFISVSSFDSPYTGVSRIRLGTTKDDNGAGGWMAAESDTNPTIGITFYDVRNLTGIGTQGREDAEMWVTSYTVQTSLDGVDWTYCESEENKGITFAGNQDQYSLKIHRFAQMVFAKFVKINILEFHGSPAMRLELYGCAEPYVTPTQPPLVTELCMEYGPWVSLSHPSPLADDEEPLDEVIQASGMCENPLKIQCRTEVTKTDYTQTGQNVICDLEHGLICRNAEQISGYCENYEVRIGCWTCEITTATAVITSTETTTERPVITSTELCVEYGPWISLSEPTPLTDDEEPLDEIIEASGICENPLRMQCRTEVTKTDYTRTGQNVICDLTHGLICRNSEQTSGYCKNYEVRIGCWSCGTLSTTTQIPLILCPETPIIMEEQCPTSCPSNHSCDGTSCVPYTDCPCFQEGKRFAPGDRMITSTCQICDCILEGNSKCKPIICPECPEGQKSELTDDCKCICTGCPVDSILCPTSGQCVKFESWCDGIVDCPDDEIDCPTEPPRRVTVTEPPAPCVPNMKSGTVMCEMNVNLFNTFDGLEYQYDICDHVMMKDKEKDAFFVTVHKVCRPDQTSCPRYAMIYVDDDMIKLGPGAEELVMNDIEIPMQNLFLLTKRFPDYVFKKEGNNLVVSSVKYSFEVTWDARQNIKIKMSECNKGEVVGLCGQYNGNVEDDRLTADGVVVTGDKEFGDSWSIGDLDRCIPFECPVDIMAVAQETCVELNEVPFTNCSYYLSIGSYLETCMAYMCECLEQETEQTDEEHVESCRCKAYSSFVEACEKISEERVQEWRLKYDCAPKCPPGLEWHECGPGCELTCDNYRNAEEICPDKCVPGCYCPSGLVKQRDKCVKPKICQDCVCRGHGDPNYITFDGHYYAFQGNCTYILAQHQSDEDDILNFQVLATNIECPEEPHTSCTAGIKIIWNGHTIVKFKNEPVNLDGRILQTEDYPYEDELFAIAYIPRKSAVVHVKPINLVVRYMDQMYGYSIQLPSYFYYNETEGLCGICNFNKSDDMYHRDGYITDDTDDFAYSWLVEDTREECTLPRVPVPIIKPVICNFTMNPCEMFLDSTLYSKACLNDVSYSTNAQASMCRSKVQYAEQCCEKGIDLNQWLHESGCSFSCEENMILQCTSACQRTCDNYKDYDPHNCNTSPLLTCDCPPGTVYKSGKCVDPKLCEICDDEGHVVGDQWNVGPCESCVCLENRITRCTTTECPTPPICNTEEELEALPKHEGACCQIYRCIPKPIVDICGPPPPIPDCDPGQVVRNSLDDEGCIVYECECDEQLCPPIIRPTSLEEGEEYVLVQSGCCSQYESQCFPEECRGPIKCGPGFKLSTYDGKCCTQETCVPKKNVCVYQHQFEVINGTQFPLSPEQQAEEEYQAGSSWKDGLCRRCSCIEDEGVVSYRCTIELCPDVSQLPDSDSYVREEEHIPGMCCPKFRRVQCVHGGVQYSDGDEWPSPDGDKCKSYRCIELENGEVNRMQKTTVCDRNCPAYATYIEPGPESPNCCGYCKPVACEENGELYQGGATWQSVTKPCFTAECIISDNMTQILYRGESCPAIPANCLPENIVFDSKGCCKLCSVPELPHKGPCTPIEIPEHDTIEYFLIHDPERGICTNSEGIKNLKKCSGQCESEIIYSADMDDFESKCKCCVPQGSVNREIALDCSDGSQITKTYQQPNVCVCSSCGGNENNLFPVPPVH